MATTRGPRSRLSGYNRLLKAIYRQDTLFSTILSQHGSSAEEIERWQKNERWLSDFLSDLQRRLVENIKTRKAYLAGDDTEKSIYHP